jgi:hypothetical protein
VVARAEHAHSLADERLGVPPLGRNVDHADAGFERLEEHALDRPRVDAAPRRPHPARTEPDREHLAAGSLEDAALHGISLAKLTAGT